MMKGFPNKIKKYLPSLLDNTDPTNICIVDDNAKAKAPKYEDLTLNLMVLRYRYVNEPESTITLNFKRTNTHALLNINMERCMG